MARKRREEEEENHERWLVSYADFITLLFAFFVVMYAISSLNEGKYKVLSVSLVNAFNPPSQTPTPTQAAPPSIVPPLPIPQRNPAALQKEKDYMTKVARDLRRVLAPLLREGKVKVTQNALGVSVEINAAILFAPGEARLNQDSSEILVLIADLLRFDSHDIQVEGHTDNQPIANSSFASNWELSTARAAGVVRMFAETGVTEVRLSAIGHAANRPVAPNDSADGRARNRRVNITILSGLPDRSVEVPSDADAAAPGATSGTTTGTTTGTSAGTTAGSTVKARSEPAQEPPVPQGASRPAP